MNNRDVGRSYMRDPWGKFQSSTGNFWCEYGACYSYNMKIAQYLPHLNTVLLRSHDESPSVTTSQHMGHLYGGNGRNFTLRFDLLERAGVHLADIADVIDMETSGWAIKVNQSYGKGWLVHLQHSGPPDALIRTRADARCALWVKHKPKSVEQLIWSMLPRRYWDHALAGRVWRVGDVFIVEEPQLTDEGRSESRVNVETTGYSRHAVQVLRRGRNNKRLCTGMVRIPERSFNPESTWYRVVPARIRSKTLSYEDRNFIRTTPSNKVLSWPLVTNSSSGSKGGS